jgi:peptide/nickel transport system substrate-binding protein
MQLLNSGEIDIMWNNTEADIPQLEKMQGVKVPAPLQPGGERLYLNLAENKDPSDPTKPHMILSDVRVRQALAYGINKQRIIDRLLFGKAKPGSGEANAGYFNCTNVGPYPYDPEKAKSLLMEAGWVPGPDGIRVAKGAKLAPDGTRLRLKYSTTSGNKLREDSQVLVVEDMKAIGVEFFIENAPSSVVIGGWDDNSPRKHGNFDIIMYTSNGGVDIHSQIETIFGSVNIPSEKNKNGTNYSRLNNAKVDDLLKQAAAEPDQAKRKDLYCQISQIVYDEAPVIYLYQRAQLHSFRDRVQGNVAGNPWENVGWDAANWWVQDGK